MKIGFFGAGKVAVSLGKYFKDNGLDIAGFYSKTFASTEFARDFTETNGYSDLESFVLDCDIIFITTGTAISAMIASITITAKSSIKVNPFFIYYFSVSTMFTLYCLFLRQSLVHKIYATILVVHQLHSAFWKLFFFQFFYLR